MKILVVDDDVIARSMVQMILTKEKHEVVQAENGEKALELLRQGGIRLVISDWNMPKMDGIDLCQQVRKASHLGYIYMIMVTSRETKDEMMVGLWAGADDFITKPIEATELILRVRKGERVIDEFLANEAKCKAFQECLAEVGWAKTGACLQQGLRGGAGSTCGGQLDLVETRPQGFDLLCGGSTFELAASPAQGLGRQVGGGALEPVGKVSGELRVTGVDGLAHIGKVLVQTAGSGAQQFQGHLAIIQHAPAEQVEPQRRVGRIDFGRALVFVCVHGIGGYG